MSWLHRLDRRATRWPAPVRWGYLGLKWYLVGTGVVIVLVSARNEFREGRAGFGTGVIAMVIVSSLSGFVAGVARARQ